MRAPGCHGAGLLFIPCRRHNGALGHSVIRRAALGLLRDGWPLCAVPVEASHAAISLAANIVTEHGDDADGLEPLR